MSWAVSEFMGNHVDLFGKLNLNMFAAGFVERARMDLSCEVFASKTSMCHHYSQVKINDNEIYDAVKSSQKSFGGKF